MDIQQGTIRRAEQLADEEARRNPMGHSYDHKIEGALAALKEQFPGAPTSERQAVARSMTKSMRDPESGSDAEFTGWL